jgi:hypothetical protein
MIRILKLIALAASAMICNSCCCTSDSKPQKLDPLPQFREFPAAPVVTDGK